MGTTGCARLSSGPTTNRLPPSAPPSAMRAAVNPMVQRECLDRFVYDIAVFKAKHKDTPGPSFRILHPPLPQSLLVGTKVPRSSWLLLPFFQ